MKYSKIYNHRYGRSTHKIRYNYDGQKLECVCKPAPEMLEWIRDEAENSSLEWMKNDAIASLKSYDETGYIVLTADNLSEAGWKSGREYFMDLLCENIACECCL